MMWRPEVRQNSATLLLQSMRDISTESAYIPREAPPPDSRYRVQRAYCKEGDYKSMKGTKRSREFGEGSPRKRKLDPIVANKIEYIDYKDVNLLRKFITENGKILPRRITGCNAKNQRAITVAIKRARALGILPFSGSV